MVDFKLKIMAQYEIKFNKQDGWSYENPEIPVESGFVELTDEEVDILVNLMKQGNTYNVEELNMEELHPDIYDKLVETCDSVAFNVALAEAARDAHYYDEENTFLDKLQEYCEREYDYDESLGDFRRWFYLFIQSWSCNQVCELYNKAGVELCWEILNFNGIEPYDYEVTIPQAIVAKVFSV